jgi:glycerol-1-phosphate dehydrogenase [NAD(P)+]
MIAENAARSLLDVERLDDVDAHETLAKALLLSGLAMNAAGTSRPCSGAEHLISHSLDEMLGDGGAGLHGEQVALGTLVAATAHESPLAGELRALYERVGLPTGPADLGLDEATLLDALAAAPSTRPDRYTVLSEYDGSRERLQALLAATFPR